MKIIHTSDLHIDSPMTSRLTPGKSRERRAELLRSFYNTLSYAKQTGADGIIIAGDLFDSELVSKRTLASVLSAIETEKDTVFFYLAGNHEKGALTSSSLPIPKNLKIFSDDWTYFDTGDAVIAGRSETSPDMFSTVRLDADRVNILVLHGEIREASDFSGVIGARELANLPCDYLALGHYHSYSEIKIGNCSAVYCGTPEGRGFDETGGKGFAVIDIEGGRVSHSFHKNAIRTLHERDIDASGTDTDYGLKGLIENELSDIPRSDLVRVNLVGTHGAGVRFDTVGIENYFENRFYYFSVRDNTRLALNPEAYANDKSLKGEFIRLVMNDSSLSEREKSETVEYGLRALLGECGE